MSQHPSEPSPILFFDTINAHQRTAALKAAIDLDLFTAIGKGNATAQSIAQSCAASERGVRILCDYLTVIGFLTKEDGRYELTPDSSMFLDRRSPAYVGGATEFLLSPLLTDGFKDIAAAVRKGGTVMKDAGTVTPENPVWVDFARGMAPLIGMPAQLMAQLVIGESKQKMKVLDIAAGHGLFGIAFAQANPNAEVVAQDWQQVLEVAQENARAAGVSERFTTLPGSAFEVEFGTGFDVILLTNFLHHFDAPTCEELLRKVHAALGEGGRAVTLEFVPNEDRVSPPGAAMFSLVMLGSTPSGDAYTFSEFESMFRNAGFSHSEFHPLPPTMEQVVISQK
ncbi:MAG: methyltransferase domain-containing protein [Pyrinomonadaceae bacterium]|nr:methyltransferase domain-containing protein [Pyrinomonadaceae bacterium]